MRSSHQWRQQQVMQKDTDVECGRKLRAGHKIITLYCSKGSDEQLRSKVVTLKSPNAATQGNSLVTFLLDKGHCCCIHYFLSTTHCFKNRHTLP